MSDLYNFHLPDKLVAQKPAHPRDSARLLVYRMSDGSISDAIFRDIDAYLHPKTTIAVNSSKVEQCRWLFFEGKVELFVLEKLDSHTIRALVRPGKVFKPGKTAELTPWLGAETLGSDSDGIRTIRLSVAHDDKRLKAYEHVPLPPYIKQDDSLSEEYQTVYADQLGSKAAPTAGLHFTDTLLTRLKGLHPYADITLHVGLGTFAKLTEEQLQSGRLHEEQYEVESAAAKVLDDAEHITAVGTTTVRTLESIIKTHGTFVPSKGSTDIFIRPGFRFQAVDSMITNFHLPSTSLLMLVAALIADKRGLSEADAAAELRRVYDHAIRENYRFYSFGDAMLLL